MPQIWLINVLCYGWTDNGCIGRRAFVRTDKTQSALCVTGLRQSAECRGVYGFALQQDHTVQLCERLRHVIWKVVRNNEIQRLQTHDEVKRLWACLDLGSLVRQAKPLCPLRSPLRAPKIVEGCWKVQRQCLQFPFHRSTRDDHAWSLSRVMHVHFGHSCENDVDRRK